VINPDGAGKHDQRQAQDKHNPQHRDAQLLVHRRFGALVIYHARSPNHFLLLQIIALPGLFKLRRSDL
jgi:hypothetical protein